MLPFDAETLHANLGQYNLAFWPASIVGLLLGLALIGLCLRPRAGAGRAGAAILVAAWTWTGIAYHLGHFATINFAAPIYGWAFLVQSALLAWTGLLRGSLRFESPSRTNRWASLAVLILAIPGLPLLEMLAGQHWPEIALFGTAPNPAALATVGFLLMAARPPRPLAIIPVLWALASGATAWELGLWQDLAAPVATLAGAALLFVGSRQTRRAYEMKNTAPAIESINAVTLATHDMARAVAFYEALGFPILYGGRTAAFTSFRLGGTHLNLIAVPAEKATGWWGRLIFHVADVDAVHARALTLGLRPDFAPRDADWRERYFHLRDPDGHELSFAKPLDED